MSDQKRVVEIKKYNCSNCNSPVESKCRYYDNKGNPICYKCKKLLNPNYNKSITKTYKCSKCNKIVYDTKRIRYDSLNELVCYECKVKDDPNYLKRSDKDYICSECGKLVINSIQYKDNSGNLLCLECKRLKNPEFLKKSEGTYICSNCGKEYTSKNHYRNEFGESLCLDCKRELNNNFYRFPKITYTCSKCNKEVTYIRSYKDEEGNLLCLNCMGELNPNYINFRSFTCSKCGYKGNDKHYIINNKVLCNNCYRNSPERIDKLKSMYSYRYDTIDTYSNSDGEIIFRFRCKYCGTEFEKSILDLSLGGGRHFWCPNSDCESQFHSNQELEVRDYIRSILNDNSITSSRDTIKNPKTNYPVELDIYIHNYNLAIEYDGIYWHKDSDHTLYKYDECSRLGIRLIQIFENEWITKNDLIKSYLRSVFGIYDHIIGARKCQIKNISDEDYRSFIEINHLQGYGLASVRLGLFYNDELVQVESFGRSRYDKSIEWEFIRECSKQGWNIIGGKSKLLKYFIENYNPNSIVSYCDKSKFSGISYLKCGFELVDETPSSYSYYKDDMIVTRFQAQKHKLKDLLGEDNFNPELTEYENMLNNGWIRLFNYGNFKFVWHRS